MALVFKEEEEGKVLEVQAQDKLTTEDYRKFVPEVEQLVQKHGRIRILFAMHDFHGWDTGGAWEDFKFGLKHRHTIERLALVGETGWQKWMATLFRPFTRAEIRYFDHSAADKAHQWIAMN